MEEFMEERYGGLTLPIPTDALMNLIERDAKDLNLYADLSSRGPGVDGLTKFFPGRRPEVEIAQELTVPGRSENRLRTTLTHEYAHVMLHDCLWEAQASSPSMFGKLDRDASPTCKRDNMITAPKADWMEWQAGYCCGALLMPVSRIRDVAASYFERHGIHAWSVRRNSPRAVELLYVVSKAFCVSPDAARVRLSQLGYMVEHDAERSLFDQ